MNPFLWVMAAWLPFVGDKPAHDADTIGSLYESETRAEVVGKPEDQRAIDRASAAEQAKTHYRTFLELGVDHPELSAEAARRLADLQMQAGVASLLDGDELLLDGAEHDEAMRLYLQLLETWSDHPRNDRVLYQLARLHEAGGRPEEALATLGRLVSEWPASAYRAEAEFRRGEILFMQKRYAEAQSAYQAVLALGPGAPFHEEAGYKHGWALFKQGLHEDSLASFVGVLDTRLVAVDGTLVPLDALGRGERELVDDTVRVIAISAAWLDGARSLDAHTDTPPYAHLLYTSLSDLYLDQERYIDAAETLQTFVNQEPLHVQAPSFQARAIEALSAGGFASLALQAKEDFISRYAVTAPFWRVHAPADRPEVLESLASCLDDVTRHYHARAQESGRAEDYARAADWYREALAALPERTDQTEVRFLLAEVLYESGQFGEAIMEYERAAYDDPEHPRAAEAGYAALLAYAEHETLLPAPERESSHRSYIDSALRFAAHFPEHERTGAVLTEAAEELFAAGDLERAVEAGRSVAAIEPPVDMPLARTAWTVVAHAEFDLGRFEAAEAAYRRIANFFQLDPDDRGAIEERLAASIYRQAEERRDAGDEDGAIAQFLRVAEEAPASDVAAAAKFDAATLLMAQQDWPRAADMLERFQRAHPEHPLSREVMRKLAVVYLRSGRELLAAGLLERISKDDETPAETRRDALWQAAELYQAAGHDTSAAAAYERYVARFPLPFDPAMEARKRLADMASDDVAVRARWLEAIVAADAAADAARSDRSRSLAAQAALALAGQQRDAFAAVRLAIPLDQSLKRKKARMKQALEAYARASEYGVAGVTTAANYQIADLYHALSRDLLASERPGSLDAAELEQYDVLIEEQAYPFEEKAIELHQANAARAADGIYDEWVRASFAALARLLPVRYAKVEISEEQVHAIR
ncbi:tetratricopeptide repeat protein [soil metagenome]